ncbi:isopeptide-forming domain-containing fimbrial protein [Bacillus sp. FSL R9-9410]|uniref:isopeptide-forming domain-containing fimbrial protein n=1 Tax=Bacillus sp. FSL R9-9410 TaxID=2921590 RepID=UPI003101423C
MILQDPIIESEKTVKNLQNKNTEIGDGLAYTIRTRNMLLASLVKNLAIADTLPEGCEYVPGTLQVDGQTVIDAFDTDNGEFDVGKANEKFGDVTNTEWHTVVFHARDKLEKRFKIQRKSQEILYHRKNQQPKFQFNHLDKLRLRKWMLLIQM